MKAAGIGQTAAVMRQRAAQSLQTSGLFALFACAGMLCVSSPALAAGTSKDAVATRAYLRASAAYASGESTWIGTSVSAIATRVSEIAGECPSALTYVPRDEAFREIGDAASTA